MPTDTLKTFSNLRRNLETQREGIIARLQAINTALGSAQNPSTIPSQPAKPSKPAPGKRAGRGRRAKGGLSLKDAVVQATTAKPLTKEEIFAAVKQLGYRFTTKKPMGSINVTLYGKDPKFRNQNGKFSPA
jgi:hypothetical protein